MLDTEARDAVIVALDCPYDQALALADDLAGRGVWVKVGMTLYYRYGPQVVDEMRARGLRVFLDLKFHDIPFQVRGAARSAALSGAELLSVHALGGAAMVEAAHDGLCDAAAELGRDRAQLVAITILTSMDVEALASVGVGGTVADEVARLAPLAVGAGADGVVCSPQEAAALRAALGPNALIVTPGVRPVGTDVADQARVATPAAAITAGASRLVIGRPITQAADPAAALEAIVEELVRTRPAA